nr:MAG TPA: hypothetical protein [Bacteriophage sp.]DAR41920.1 MAG TPA: hypothetical protein [Bacteriophage sp.]
MFYPIVSALFPTDATFSAIPLNLAAFLAIPFIGLKLLVPVLPIYPFCRDIGLFKLKLFCVRE